MKTRLRNAIAALTLACPLLAAGHAGDSLENVLVLYDFNKLICNDSPNTPAFVSPCVCATDVTLNRLCQQLEQCGPDGTKFRNFSGWDTCYDYSFARTDFTSVPGTLSYDVTVRPDAIANISGVSFDWMRPTTSSADSIQATIFWEDAAGAIQYSSTGPIALTDVGVWTSRTLDFPIDVAPLPTGIDTSGKEFHVEIYAWGADGGSLYLDNLTLNGTCAPIPEPGGAVLIAAAGLALLLRRRNRS